MNKMEKMKNYAQTEFSKEKFLESWAFTKYEFREIIFYPNFKKHFIFVYLIYLVGYSALLRANVDFLDDTARSFSGATNWGNFSRYLSNFFSHFLHMGWNLLDQSPINQLIAIGIISLSSVFLTRIFFKKEEITYWHLLASLPIGLSPFFLQNMAFKYDSPYMSLAVLASIFPFLFLKNKLSFYMIGILSLLITLTTYQAGHQVFIVLAIFLILKAYLENNSYKEIKELCFKFITVFIAALLLFMIFINHSTANKADKITLLFPHEIPVEGFNNFKRYLLEGIYKSFEGTFFLNLLITALIFAVINITIKYKSILKPILSILLIGFAAIGSLGLFVFIENTSLLTRMRNYNGFAVFWVGVLFLVLLNKNLYVAFVNKILVFFFGFNLLVIANVFGNALEIQGKYNNYRIISVINTLNKDSIDEKLKANLGEGAKLLIKFPKEGMIAPQLHNNMKHLPLLKNLMRDKLAGGANFASSVETFYKYNNLKYGNKFEHGNNFVGIKMMSYKDHLPNCLAEIIKVSDNLLHKITYYSNNCAELEFK